MRTGIRLLTFVISLFIYSGLYAQDCTYYFPRKAGTMLETKSYDAKGKVLSTAKSKVLDVSGSSIKVECEVSDNKDKPVAKSEYTVSCKNGEFVMDLGGYLKGVDLEQYKNMDVKMETEDLLVPSGMKAGDILKDAKLTIKIANNGFTIMTMVVRIYNRKVETIEKITIPAGTYECAKITYDIDTKVGFNISAKGIEWICKDVGVVKSESYDKKGKLQGYTQLTSIK